MAISTRRCGFNKIPNRLAVVTSSRLLLLLLWCWRWGRYSCTFMYVLPPSDITDQFHGYVGCVHLVGELLPPDGVGRFTFPQ